jgi:hypothetical protein
MPFAAHWLSEALRTSKKEYIDKKKDVYIPVCVGVYI